MYSHGPTRSKNGPLRDVLQRRKAPEGQDWAMVWTGKSLLSDRVIERGKQAGFHQRAADFALEPMDNSCPIWATAYAAASSTPTPLSGAGKNITRPAFVGGAAKFVVSNAGRVLPIFETAVRMSLRIEHIWPNR